MSDSYFESCNDPRRSEEEEGKKIKMMNYILDV